MSLILIVDQNGLVGPFINIKKYRLFIYKFSYPFFFLMAQSWSTRGGGTVGGRSTCRRIQRSKWAAAEVQRGERCGAVAGRACVAFLSRGRWRHREGSQPREFVAESAPQRRFGRARGARPPVVSGSGAGGKVWLG